MRPRYPATSKLDPRIMATMNVQVLYFHPRTACPTSETPKSAMNMTLAAMLGAYPKLEPSAGQPGPILLHFMSAILNALETQQWGSSWTCCWKKVGDKVQMKCERFSWMIGEWMRDWKVYIILNQPQRWWPLLSQPSIKRTWQLEIKRLQKWATLSPWAVRKAFHNGFGPSSRNLGIASFPATNDKESCPNNSGLKH